MTRVGTIAAFSLTSVLIVGAGIVWNTTSQRSTAPAVSSAADGEADVDAAGDALVRRAGGAIRAHDSAGLARYLAKGLDPDSVESEGETLLNTAVVHGTPVMVEMLLAAGADPDLPGSNGLGPLALAALAGHHQMLERLVAASDARRPAPELPAAAAGDSAADPVPAYAAESVKAIPPAEATVDAVADGQQTASVDAVATDAVAIAPEAGAPADHSRRGAAAAYRLPPPAARAARAEAPSAADGVSSPGGKSVAPVAAPAASRQSGAATGSGGVPTAWILATQKRLAQLGYYQGPIDGIAGSQTAAAIRSYQTVAEVPVNGLVSADLLRRIGASAEAPLLARNAPAASDAEAQALRSVLNKFQTDLGQTFNSDTHPDVMRRYCRQNVDVWVHDEATQRAVFCRDIVGLAPR